MQIRHNPHNTRRRKQTLTLPSTDSDRMDQAGIGSTPHHPHRVGTGSTPSPVGAGVRPAISHGVGAGLKPAPTTTPRTAEDRLHLCENATIHTTPGAADGDCIGSQVKRFQAQDVLFGKLRPYPAKVTCPKRSGVSVGETDRTHLVGAGFRPDIARGVVEAGLKPASTTNTAHRRRPVIPVRKRHNPHTTRRR